MRPTLKYFWRLGVLFIALTLFYTLWHIISLLFDQTRATRIAAYSYEEQMSVLDSIIEEGFVHRNSELYETLMLPSHHKLCDSKTDFFIGVIAKPDKFDHRKVYRRTLLSPLSRLTNIKYAFLVGLSTGRMTNTQLEKEAQEYGDIIQGNFTDNYNNLTIKSLFLLKWAGDHCANARFVMKVDDDVYLNVEGLYQYLRDFGKLTFSIIGNVFTYSKPNHDPSSKWHVKNYFKESYPTYVSGGAYVMTGDLPIELFLSCMKRSFIRIEDVFITGICASNLLGIEVSYIKDSHYDIARGDIDNIDPLAIHTSHSFTAAEMIYLWNKGHPDDYVDVNYIN